MQSTMDIGDDSVSSSDLLIIVVDANPLFLSILNKVEIKTKKIFLF